MKPGTTLVELLLVLCALGLLAGVALIGVRQPSARSESAAHDPRRTLDSVRSLVVRDGRQRTVVVEDTAAVYAITILPDGSVIGDSLFVQSRPVDRLSGRARIGFTGGLR
jgi:hypothetical protein